MQEPFLFVGNQGFTIKTDYPTLRRRAEEFLDRNPEAAHNIPAGDLRKLIEDLHVHQIELEMQNEALRRAQLEIEKVRDRYSDLYDFAPVGYFTISDTGLILEANLYGARLLNIDCCRRIYPARKHLPVTADN